MSSRAVTAADAGLDRRGPLRARGPWLVNESGDKVILQGITYGPFPPNGEGVPWPEEDQMRADLAYIRGLGFNTLRVYEAPHALLLHACEASGLRLLCSVPWTQHVDCLNDVAVRRDAVERVTQEAVRLSREASVLGFLVGNEIEATLVRWMGPKRLRAFLEELVAIVHRLAPGKLVSYANYPSTEYLMPRNADFVAMNVYLEKREEFERYLRRLQIKAAGRPVVVTEFGLDSQRHGEKAQREALLWQREVCTRAGVAGNFWFSYTDEWFRGGEEVTDWSFGLCTCDRIPKAICRDLEKPVRSLSLPRGRDTPISVVVCTRNGAATLRGCLAALQKQSYPHYEVLVVDDGSTDGTAAVAKEFPWVRYEHQSHAGLSAARNRGAALARGEIIAYTDDDCIPDEDWLVHLATAFADRSCVAAGGPNLPPAPRSMVEAVVAIAPGGPAEVLLDDNEAEHLPGCNLAIRRDTLLSVGGFEEEFAVAGDDVDICWRLQAQGGKLRFVPAALVWHHRRATVRGYLRQQAGYGFAEAQLIRRHPERFAWCGGACWSGTIYGSGSLEEEAIGPIHFGRWGLASFQCVYRGDSAHGWLASWAVGLPWLVIILLLCAFALVFPPMAWAVASAVGLAIAAAFPSSEKLRGLPVRRVLLLWALCFVQPLVRDAARWRGMLRLRAWPRGKTSWLYRLRWPFRWEVPRFRTHTFAWRGSAAATRLPLLEAFTKRTAHHGWRCRPSAATSRWDLEIVCPEDFHFSVRTVTEYHERGVTLTRLEASMPLFSWWRSSRAKASMSEVIREAAHDAGLRETPHHRRTGRSFDQVAVEAPQDSCEISEI